VATSTERVVLIAQNFNLSAAREAIAREAELQGVRVDSIEEARRRLSTELTVTVTGEIAQSTVSGAR